MKFRRCVFFPASVLLLLMLCGCGMEKAISEPETVVSIPEETVIQENELGALGEYDYELWKDRGSTEMTLEGEGCFSCQWSDINNALFRVGRKFDCTRSWEEIGEITVSYGAEYYPVGNSYLCIYGWSREPLVEYYVVQSWGNWRPPGAESMGVISVDGSEYDVYVTTRTNQPSIDGTQTFRQFWSVRKGKRTEDTVSLTEHFRAWKSMGLELGKLYEAALTVEGYQSSGFARIYQNEITVEEQKTAADPATDTLEDMP